MMGLIIAIHVLACTILITVVLIQRGRGGGFIENLSGLESMIGPRTPAMLTKITTVCAVIFFVTCLLMAVMSVRKSKSLLEGYKAPAVSVTVQNTTAETPAAVPAQEPAPAATPAVVEKTQPATPEPVTITNTTRNAPPTRKGEWN
jgi:preprotein translocase subunit SecG